MGLPSVGEMMSVTRELDSSSSKVLGAIDDAFGLLDDFGHELVAGEFALLHLAKLVFPLAGHVGLGQRVGFDRAEKLQQRFGLRRGHEFALRALHVLLVDQAVDRVGAGGGGAQAAFLHGLGEFLVIDELAGAFHGGEQRGLGVARRRLGGFRVEVGLDRFRLGRLPILEALSGGQLESGESSSSMVLP